MRFLVNYLRQAFCKHDWQIAENHVESFKTGTKVYMRCKKCGYHQKHWKYV